MKKPKQGTKVWSFYFCPVGKQPRAKVLERVFEKEWHPTNVEGPRWIIIMEGRPYGKGYGISCRPESVFATKEEAITGLTDAFDRHVGAITQSVEEAIEEVK